MKRSRILVVMLMLSAVAVYAADVTTNFQDGVNGYSGTRDAHIYSVAVTNNYGSDTNLIVDGDAVYSYFIKWDVSSLPTNASVLDAYATMTMRKPSYSGLQWFACLRDWVESEVTWQRYAIGQNWEEYGAVSSIDRGTDLVSSYLIKNDDPTNSPYSLPFTPVGIALAQEWISNPSANCGIKVEGGVNKFLSYSSEDPVSTNRPKLTIVYTLDPQPEIRVVRNGVEVFTGNEKTIAGTLPGSATLLTYTVTNSGTAALSLTGASPVVLSAIVGCSASVITQPSATISAGGASDCVISITPPVSGYWSVTAAIQNNDRTGSENPFSWVIKGVARGPDIEVKAQGVTLTDGGTNDLGGFMTNVTRQVLYTIKNTGNLNLTNGTPTISSAVNCSASVVLAPDSVLVPGAATPMILSIAPAGQGALSFDLNLPNNDADEGPFNVTVSGQCTNLISLTVQEGVTGSGICEDTYLDLANPGNNYGSNAGFDLRTGASAKNGLIRWDVSGVPAGAIVQSASVDLHQEDGRVYVVSLYESKRSWVVNQATWNIYSTGNSWEMPGGTGTLDRGTAAIGSATSPGTTNFMNIALTNLSYVQSWIGAPSSNKGFAVLSAGAQQINFRSSDYASSTSRPRLNLTYAPVVNPNPEITVKGNNSEIVSGSTSVSSNNYTDFGSVECRWDYETATRLFAIENSGGSSLALTGSTRVAISGAHASEFTVLAQPGTNVAGYGVAAFQIAFTPAALGVRTALVTIAGSDADEPSYTFTIKGTGYERELRWMYLANSFISPGTGFQQHGAIPDIAAADGHPEPLVDDNNGGGADVIDQRYGRNPDMDPVWWLEDGTDRGLIHESTLVSENNYDKKWDLMFINSNSEMFSDRIPPWDARQTDGLNGPGDVPDWGNEKSDIVHTGVIFDWFKSHSPDCRLLTYESWVRSANGNDDWYTVNPDTTTDYWYGPEQAAYAARLTYLRMQIDGAAPYGGGGVTARNNEGWRVLNWLDSSSGLYRWVAANDIDKHASSRGEILSSMMSYAAIFEDDLSDIIGKNPAAVSNILKAANASPEGNELSVTTNDWIQLADITDRVNGLGSYPKVLTSTNRIVIPESGSVNFQVKLSKVPSGDITVTVSNVYASTPVNIMDNDIAVTNGGTLTFNSSNWNDWQTVSVFAAEDADQSNTVALIYLKTAEPGVLPPAGSAEVVAEELDNDTGGVTYSLTVNPNNPAWGAVSPTGGTYSANSNAQLSATASPYYHFVEWTGDLGGTTNPVTIVMTTNKILTAVFTEDQVTNSTPAWWLAQHGLGTNDSAALATGANGLKVWESYIAGLNPTNPASVFLMSDLRSLTSANVFQWQGVSGRVYTVYWSSNLLNGFQSLATNIPWTGNIFTDAVHGAANEGFYQIKVKLAE